MHHRLFHFLLQMWWLVLLLCVGVHATPFPRPNSNRHAYIIVSSAGNLPSAVRDAVTHGVVWSRRGFALHYYLDVSTTQREYITTQLNTRHLQATFDSTSKAVEVDIAGSLRHATGEAAAVDIVVAIAAHGYRSGNHNYIIFAGNQITDVNLASWFAPLNALHHVRALALVDTCHSGSMVGFTKTGPTLPTTATVCSLSACSNAESDMDDLSDEFGFGGGLTACVVNNIGFDTPFEVDALSAACRHRMQAFGTHPQLTWL